MFVEAPLHPMKIDVWIAVSRRRLSIKLLMVRDTGNYR
jgi:hypothetical protein